MEFYTSYSSPRPIRLSKLTRSFAYESLNHKYGLDTKQTPHIKLDLVSGIKEMTPLEQYDIAIEKICREAPIRICKDEMLSGAATLGDAIYHVVPAFLEGKSLFSSVSHLTIDFPTVLDIGIGGIKENIISSIKKQTEPMRLRFLQSALHCIECFEIWHKRYLEALEERAEYSRNLEALRRVPMSTPRSFYEAVQSIWFTFAFVRLCGNWPGIGRLDVMLGKYLKNDLENGILNLDEAREILAHFFIKGCEWVCGGDYGSGDAQHYQNLVLAGIDEDGNEVTNEVTYLCLDIIEELGISDFPTTLRINSETDDKLLRRAAEVIRHGGGILAVYNEDLILRSLTDFGYSEQEAALFANDGCWEVQIPGKTNFIYVPFDSLAILQKQTLKQYSGEALFENFEDLYSAYCADLKAQIEKIYENHIAGLEKIGVPSSDWNWRATTPCTVVSLFEQGCIEKGLSYFEGGPIYNVCSPHIGGLADTANSLYAIKKLVFDDKKLTLSELFTALKNDWQGYEELRQFALNNYTYYGNDSDEVDLLAAKILSDFSDMCNSLNGRSPIKFPSGVSTFGRQIEWLPQRSATPFGKCRGDILAGNLSPTPGTDKKGATAIIRSYCKADLKKQQTGAALDIKLLPSDVKGEAGIAAISGLIRGFAALGGYFMQLDVVDKSILLEAQSHPENYQALSVRVSGWNARFVTLNREWQDMIIGEVKG